MDCSGSASIAIAIRDNPPHRRSRTAILPKRALEDLPRLWSREKFAKTGRSRAGFSRIRQVFEKSWPRKRARRETGGRGLRGPPSPFVQGCSEGRLQKILSAEKE